MDKFLDILQNFGIAVTVMFAMGVAIWRVGVWAGTTIFQPALARHMKLVDDLNAAVVAQTTAMSSISERQTDLVESQRELAGQQKATLEQMKALAEEHRDIIRLLNERRDGRKSGG